MLTDINLILIFGTVLLLALLPGISSLTVMAHTAQYGIAHGIATTLGITSADALFIAIAVLGLSLLTQTPGIYLSIAGYIGGLYLVYLGIRLWLSHHSLSAVKIGTEQSYTSSFLAGFLITLADQKAVLFYLGLFPLVIDYDHTTLLQAIILVITTLSALILAKGCYILLAVYGMRHIEGSLAMRILNRSTAVLLMVIGLWILIRPLFD